MGSRPGVDLWSGAREAGNATVIKLASDHSHRPPFSEMGSAVSHTQLRVLSQTQGSVHAV